MQKNNVPENPQDCFEILNIKSEFYKENYFYYLVDLKIKYNNKFSNYPKKGEYKNQIFFGRVKKMDEKEAKERH